VSAHRDPRIVRWSVWLYTQLMWCYPRPVRQRTATAQIGVAHQILRATYATSGTTAVLAHWPWLLWDLVASVAQTWFTIIRRIGRDGREFTLLKFRTMTDDERREITSIGRWLRRISLDELPQLYNVVRGDMALVGSRPPLATAGVPPTAAAPGITGPGQLARFAGASAIAEQRINQEYAARQTAWRDLGILARTAAYLLRRRG
jgi:lipopolysaccharide/colanic/teichoic acid biosynthesis glycosyltransferase